MAERAINLMRVIELEYQVTIVLIKLQKHVYELLSVTDLSLA